MICFLLFIVPLIIGVLLAIWIYKDANKRGKEGIVWAIILFIVTLLFSLLGLIILIIVWLVTHLPVGGEPKSTYSERRCSNCAKKIRSISLMGVNMIEIVHLFLLKILPLFIGYPQITYFFCNNYKKDFMIIVSEELVVIWNVEQKRVYCY